MTYNVKDYGREWRKKNIEKCREYCKKYYQKYKKQNQERSKLYGLKLRADVINKLGGKCIICGYDKDIRGLCVDHINGGGTQEEIKIGTQGIYHKVLENTEGYQCLCATCNQIKKSENHEF